MILNERDLTFLSMEQDPVNIARYYNARHWSWYEKHKDDIVLQRRILLWEVTIRVRDIKRLLTSLWGNPPGEGGTPNGEYAESLR